MLSHGIRDIAGMEIFARKCVICETTGTPACPTCPQGQSCQVTLPSCDECSKSYCAVDDNDDGSSSGGSSSGSSSGVSKSSSSGGSSNTAAIAGGVVGGLAVIAILTYLVWRFCIKAKRRPTSTVTWEQQDRAAGGSEMASSTRDNRASMHTVHSIASTVLTRASNIIQIAYIPGVTNRAQPNSPGVLVPPVPPIPINISQAGTPNGPEDQHFFVPGNLRDSTYSGISSYSDRTSYARTSYAPRSSIASTIYGKSAVVVAPAQTGTRAKPAMVSVKSTSNGASGVNAPPVPAVDYEKYNAGGSALRPPSPTNSTFSVGSTFLNSATTHTAMTARPMMVRVGSGPKAIETIKEKGSTPSSPLSARASTTSPKSDQGPFADPPDSPGKKSTSNLSAVIEEATRRASQRESAVPPPRGRSPFGDENAFRDM